MTERGRAAPSHRRVRAIPFWAAAAFGLAGSLGCLADPPTFAPRGQIPPFIIAGQVDPPLGSIYEGSRSFQINVPFRSEDVNTDLWAALYLDLVPGIDNPGNNVLDFAVVPASNYEELRWLTMNVDLQISAARACHSLTLVMTYRDNLDFFRGSLPLDEERAARVVWWLNVGDTDGETRMAECPGASQVDAVPNGG